LHFGTIFYLPLHFSCEPLCSLFSASDLRNDYSILSLLWKTKQAMSLPSIHFLGLEAGSPKCKGRRSWGGDTTSPWMIWEERKAMRFDLHGDIGLPAWFQDIFGENGGHSLAFRHEPFYFWADGSSLAGFRWPVGRPWELDRRERGVC